MYNLSERVNVNFEYLVNTISELTDYCSPLEKTSRKAYVEKPRITPGVKIILQRKLINHRLSIKIIAIN